MENELKLYKVNIKYIRNLTNVEARFHKQGEEIPIMQNSPQTNNKGDANKQGRPYLGILVLIEDRKYCIPLCSLDEKPKYDTMSENITMRKIRDENGNVIGILNINNMIPVRDEYLEEIKTEIQSTDSNNTKEHKILHQKELTWCKNHIKEIQHLAEDLHQMVCNGENFKKRKICPNYTALENECDKAKKMPNRQKQKQQKKLQKQNNHKNNNDIKNRIRR